MSTKKPRPRRGKQRDQTERDEPEIKAGSPASRSAIIPIIMAIVVILALVMIVLTAKEFGNEIGGGNGLPRRQAWNQTKSPREAVSISSSLLAGIPQHADALGKPTAPVTLELFANFECISCREFELEAMRYLIEDEDFILTGKLRIEYLPWPGVRSSFTVFREEQAAALAAGVQNKMWNFIELFYYEEPEDGKGELPSNYAWSIAAQVPGLNLMQWDSDRRSTSLTSQIVRDVHFAIGQHFQRTPAFLIGKTGGPMNQITEPDATKIDNAIQGLLGT